MADDDSDVVINSLDGLKDLLERAKSLNEGFTDFLKEGGKMAKLLADEEELKNKDRELKEIYRMSRELSKEIRRQ